jgi:hypothetical protein
MIAYYNSRLKHLNNRYTEDEIKLAKQITSLNSRGIKSVGQPIQSNEQPTKVSN